MLCRVLIIHDQPLCQELGVEKEVSRNAVNLGVVGSLMPMNKEIYGASAHYTVVEPLESPLNKGGGSTSALKVWKHG